MAICLPSNCSGSAWRRAFTVIEIAIAVGLLGLLMTASVQVLRAMQMQQRAADRRAGALHTVQALAEQISNLSWDDVTSERLKQLELPPPITEFLPEAQMTASLIDESEPVPAKRVSIELSWRGPKGQPAAPVRMTIWVFAN